jgi:type IV pilus assembly protein PilY1
MWKFGCSTSSNDASCKAGTSAANLGQTWSTPRVIRLKGDNNLYVVFGGGYDTCEDSDPTTASMCGSGKSGLVSGADPKGSGIFVLNATTGAEAAYINLKSIQAGAGRVAADVVPVDTNFDGYTDVLYAVDTRGYVWRINTSDLTNSGQGTAPSTWSTKTYQLAAVSNWGDSTQFRKLMYSPDVVVVGDTAVVLFGSGNREQPRGTSTAVTTVNNRFFGLRDNYATAPAATIDGTTCDPSGDTALAANCDLLNVTTSALDYSTAVLSGKGWVIDLMAGSSLVTKEQVVTTPTTLGGVTYFSTFQPTPVGGGSGTCGGLGKGYGYAIDFFTGALPGGTSGNIWSPFTSPGIPPSPVSGVVNVNGTGVPFVIGARSSSGAGGSALEGRKVTMPITQRRAKIYRYKKID